MIKKGKCRGKKAGASEDVTATPVPCTYCATPTAPSTLRDTLPYDYKAAPGEGVYTLWPWGGLMEVVCQPCHARGCMGEW